MGCGEDMHADESYPASGLSGEIIPLLLLCGVSAWSLWPKCLHGCCLSCFLEVGEAKASFLLPIWSGLVLMDSNPLHGCPWGFI